MAFFSVIVPVYNVEQYIDECVESVLRQSFDDIELILVDDGSPDNCPTICDGYAEKDSRVKVIHKQNGGLSSARNAGLDTANGDFVIFLDSDDYWNDTNALKQLSASIKKSNADIAIFGCTDLDVKTGRSFVSRNDYDMSIVDSGDRDAILHYFFSTGGKLPGGATISATRRTLVEDNGIRFKEGITAEDFDWIFSTFLNASAFSAINNPFYVYRKGRATSITSSAGMKSIDGVNYTVDKWLPISENISSPAVKADVQNYLAHIYTTGIITAARFDKAERKEAIEKLKPNRRVLDHAMWKKTKLVKLFLRLFGYGFTVWITNEAFKISRYIKMRKNFG